MTSPSLRVTYHMRQTLQKRIPRSGNHVPRFPPDCNSVWQLNKCRMLFLSQRYLPRNGNQRGSSMDERNVTREREYASTRLRSTTFAPRLSRYRYCLSSGHTSARPLQRKQTRHERELIGGHADRHVENGNVRPDRMSRVKIQISFPAVIENF